MLSDPLVSFTVSSPSAEPIWTQAQQKILATLQHEENRRCSVKSLCQKAGISEYIWDLRRLKSDYPKHRDPSDFQVDFTWIVNPVLRQQVKDYFRIHLPRWKPTTFAIILRFMKPFLMCLPPEIHVGTLSRRQIEPLLSKLAQLSDYALCRCLQFIRAMFNFMATSPAWTGTRPPRFLIWNEDIPSRPGTLPRPIPPQVLDQLDSLLEKAVEAMKQGQSPAILPPMLWDAIHILRQTGMRAEDLAHLKAPDREGRNGCLDQDTEGDWWIRLHHRISKMNKDHRIPTKTSDGVIDAVRRQQSRVKEMPDHFGEHYLFRHTNGILTYTAIKNALGKLTDFLTYEQHPYRIAPHQFRHTIATDMIEMGIDIYTVKEFLGHKSLAMTERYVKVYLRSLKAKYDAYRAKKMQTSASEMIANQVHLTQMEGDVDGGWVDGKVGKLYLSPLPDGAGHCAHLPMHDECPDTPHCPTCPKLRANKRHLPMWENKAKSLHLTVEALQANPMYERARQKHEKELRHAEKVVETIKREGFWDGRIHNTETDAR